MITLEQAYKILFKNLPKPVTGEVLLEDSIGYILAENVKSSVMMPPFNKSAVDGYAFTYKDLGNVPAELRYIGLIEAGDSFNVKPRTGDCVKIMTGAAVPHGFDSIIMIEDTEFHGDRVTLKKKIKQGDNISWKGEDLKKDKIVLRKGKEILGPEVMVAASLGREKIKVYKKPAVSVLNTGNEIVNPPGKLSGNTIYNSNGPLLVSFFKNLHLEVNYLGIAKDTEPILYDKIKEGLKSDVLLISGGVSVGDYDLVPYVLKKAGVKILFHTVKIKPGKPVLVGRKGNTVVFGLPGNPNSNYLACHIFIVPAIKKIMGYDDYRLKVKQGIINADLSNTKGRIHFVLTKIEHIGDEYYLNPVKSHGSADVPSLSESDGFMILHEDTAYYKKGSKLPFFSWKKT
jgi:molybdopterin molybdotransferase